MRYIRRFSFNRMKQKATNMTELTEESKGQYVYPRG